MDSVDHLIALLTPIEVPATLGRYNRFSTDQTKIHGNLVGARLNFWQRCLTGRPNWNCIYEIAGTDSGLDLRSDNFSWLILSVHSATSSSIFLICRARSKSCGG